MYDIIIIGAGPAGMTAAIYARRAKMKTLILESSSYGGQIINTLDIENYPCENHISGFEWATKLYQQVQELKAEFLFEEVISINDKKDYKEVTTKKNCYQGKTIIIATGAQARKLQLANEKEWIGKGISYCATCDGNFYKNQVVAIVGGGNTALEDALYLSNIAKKVFLIHRREEFRASPVTIEEVKAKDNIEILYNSHVIELSGDNHLSKIKVQNTNHQKQELEVTGLFIAIGQIPASNIFKNEMATDSHDYIIANENCHTNKEGIYVAGDARTKELRQLVTATADGAIAATEAIKYIQKQNSI